MADETREIRARVDILDLVGQRVALKRAGKTWKGLCPFHEDRNPSFVVSPEMGRYRCWSCGEAGDVFTWVMKTQNVEFKEALEILAKAAGVTLSRSGAKQDPSQRETWQTAMAEALSFFREQLSKSTQAQEYCSRRGISKAALETWEIGYAPDVGEALASALRRKGLPLGECRQLFLVDQDAGGGYFDKFRARLMFPIRNERGELVAFGGRLLGDGNPKYINSGDTPLYRKSRVLYGMHVAKDVLQKEHRAILVEGYLDVVACHEAGLKGALASLGTSLAEDHAKLLKRWCDEVVILYDSDAAGQKAARRAVEALSAEGLKVRVALMPEGEDPDTLLKAGGPAALQRTIEKSVAPLEFEVQELFKKRKPEEEEFWVEAVEVLAGAPNEMELDRFIVQLAPLYPNLRDPIAAQKAIRKEVAKYRRTPARPLARAVVQAPAAPRLLETSSLKSDELALFEAFLDSALRERAWSALQDSDLMTTGLAADLAQAIAKAFPLKPPEGLAAAWIADIQPEELHGLLADIPFDRRATPLSEQLLEDVLRGMRTKKESRELAGLKREGLSFEESARRIEKLKGKV